MSKEPDRAPLSTEIPSPESELDLHPTRCWTSGLEIPRLHKSADAAAGDELAVGQMLSGRYRIERKLVVRMMGHARSTIFDTTYAHNSRDVRQPLDEGSVETQKNVASR
jgi:hypothetical protein